MKDIYKEGLRRKVRFQFKGLRSIEELCCDLSVEELDSIFQALNAERKAKSEESLLSKQNPETVELDLKIEIVRDIVATFLREQAEREETANKAARKQKYLELAAQKKEDELVGNLSADELIELANQL
jgi:VIT1/CCC1 family predicted Fe2+/Mn2+ transporter